MELGEALMRWTVRLALLAAACRFVVQVPSPWRRRGWAVGWLLMVVHVALAFQVRHGWSHAAAAEHVARRTAADVGVASSGGLWLNYLFLLLWTADVCGWLPARSRPWWLGFWWFMALNAAVVFERGPTRWIGLAAAMACLGSWLSRRVSGGWPR